MLATPAPIDARAFRDVMSCFATGVTVISHASAGQVHGMTANAFLSVSLDPPLVLVSLNETARMCRLLVVDQCFGISMLAEDQTTLSNHFAGRSHAHPVVAWRWEADVPLLVGAVAQITARVVATHPVGDHTLFIGQVEQLAHSAGRPLIFYAGSYARLAE